MAKGLQFFWMKMYLYDACFVLHEHYVHLLFSLGTVANFR